MSSKQVIHARIVKEINLIPAEKRQELYELIHNFRVGLKPEENKTNEIMDFAGSWSDLSEEDLKNFNEEIEQRRQASSRRFEF